MGHTWKFRVLALFAALTACNEDDVGVSAQQAVVDAVVDAGQTDVASVDAGPEVLYGCVETALLMYLMTEDGQLLSFKPDTRTLTLIGKVNCPGTSGAAFSMALDRNAIAWVLYTDAQHEGQGLYRVDTADASCTATTFKPGTLGLSVFGMGFTRDAPGGKTESLYVVGGQAEDFWISNNTLGKVSFPDLKLTTIGTTDVSGGVELTGNGNGALYGFFSETTAGAASVREISKTTGRVVGEGWHLSASVLPAVGAQAIGLWGGEFYIFAQPAGAPSSNVYKLTPGSGKIVEIMDNIGMVIVGAGVSSCAPTDGK